MPQEFYLIWNQSVSAGMTRSAQTDQFSSLETELILSLRLHMSEYIAHYLIWTCLRTKLDRWGPQRRKKTIFFTESQLFLQYDRWAKCWVCHSSTVTLTMIETIWVETDNKTTILIILYFIFYTIYDTTRSSGLLCSYMYHKLFHLLH